MQRQNRGFASTNIANSLLYGSPFKQGVAYFMLVLKKVDVLLDGFEGKQEAKRLAGSPNLETHLDAIEEWPLSEGRLRAASSETYPYSSSVSCLQPGPGRNWQRETTSGRPLTKLVDSLE